MPPKQEESQGTGLQNMPWNYEEGSNLFETLPFEVGKYQTPTNIFTQGGALQDELDDYFDTKTTTNWEGNLGINWQDTFGLGD